MCAKFARRIACIAQGSVTEEYVMETRYQVSQLKHLSNPLSWFHRGGQRTFENTFRLKLTTMKFKPS